MEVVFAIFSLLRVLPPFPLSLLSWHWFTQARLWQARKVRPPCQSSSLVTVGPQASSTRWLPPEVHHAACWPSSFVLNIWLNGCAAFLGSPIASLLVQPLPCCPCHTSLSHKGWCWAISCKSSLQVIALVLRPFIVSYHFSLFFSKFFISVPIK
jgi:hypothetical protein